MASIYKQPIAGGLRKKGGQKFGSHNFNSMTTNDQTNNIGIGNSMNINGLQADGEDIIPINSIGL